MAPNSGRKRGEVVEVTLVGGDFVDLTITEYQMGYATFLRALNGALPLHPTRSAAVASRLTTRTAANIALNRAWHAAGRTFADEAKTARAVPY